MGSAASVPGLICPSCQETGTLQLRLEDGVIVCHDCDEEFDRKKVEANALGWARLLGWYKGVSGDPLSDEL